MTNNFNHIVELHYFLIGHSITCVIVSIWSFLTVDKNYVIDRRQYFILLGISTIATFTYFIALGYVVLSGSQYFHGESFVTTFVNFLEGVLDLIQTISRNQFSFFIAVIMNFALLYGVFALNMCSMYLVEIAKSLEHRRTGGRDTNEVELGGFKLTSSSENKGNYSAASTIDINDEEVKLNVDTSRQKTVWGPGPSMINQ